MRKEKCRNMTNFLSKVCSITHNCIPDVNIFKQKTLNSRTILHTLASTKKCGNNEKCRFGIIARGAIEKY